MGLDLYRGYVESVITIADLDAAATTDTVALPTLPTNSFPLFAAFNVGAYFTGGTISAMTAQYGDAGDPNGYLAALNVFDTTALGSWTVATLGVEAEYGSTGPALEATAYAGLVLFTATGDDVDQATTGHLTCRQYYKRYEIK